MDNLSARHQLVCAIVHGYPDAAVVVATAMGVPLPEHDQVVPAPDSHYVKDGGTVYTDATVRLLRDGRPVFFLTVEMQRRYVKDKYATLHLYHGSGVNSINAAGHLLVLSDRASEAAKFRKEDVDRKAELAFRASFGSSGDVEPMRGKDGLSLGARAVPAALADLSDGVPDWAWDTLKELTSGNSALANLYFRTMIEEAPNMTMVEAGLTPEMLKRLRELESFRDYEARFQAEARAEARAEAEARVKEAEARVKAEDLKDFLILRGDKPTRHAFATINASRNVDVLDAWLKRAYQGEASTQLFPEPEVPQP